MTVVLFYSCEEPVTAVHVVQWFCLIPPQNFILLTCV